MHKQRFRQLECDIQCIQELLMTVDIYSSVQLLSDVLRTVARISQVRACTCSPTTNLKLEKIGTSSKTFFNFKKNYGYSDVRISFWQCAYYSNNSYRCKKPWPDCTMV